MAKVKGARSLVLKLGRISRRTREEVEGALLRGGLAIEVDAVDGIISGPKTGRVYASKHRKGARHQASAPGEFPAADSGRLHQSITTTPIPGQLRVEVGANVPYAPMLEHGTSKMEPRPFMGPAFDANEKQIVAAVARAVRRGSRSR